MHNILNIALKCHLLCAMQPLQSETCMYNLTYGSEFPHGRSYMYIRVSYSTLDVNECSVNKGDCSHICINSIGSYTCYCPFGYGLSIDARTCVGETV